MPPVRTTALAFFALTVGLWVGLGDGSAWRMAAVVLGAALVSWALLRSAAVHGAVECDGVERHTAAACAGAVLSRPAQPGPPRR